MSTKKTTDLEVMSKEARAELLSDPTRYAANLISQFMDDMKAEHEATTKREADLRQRIDELNKAKDKGVTISPRVANVNSHSTRSPVPSTMLGSKTEVWWSDRNTESDTLQRRIVSLDKDGTLYITRPDVGLPGDDDGERGTMTDTEQNRLEIKMKEIADLTRVTLRSQTPTGGARSAQESFRIRGNRYNVYLTPDEQGAVPGMWEVLLRAYSAE